MIDAILETLVTFMRKTATSFVGFPEIVLAENFICLQERCLGILQESIKHRSNFLTLPYLFLHFQVLLGAMANATVREIKVRPHYADGEDEE